MSMNDIDIPPEINQPVLRQVYPALLDHVDKYGHPNIPLGTTDGKRCKTLRRLYLQNKLSPREVELLQELKFRLGDFDDIYNEADFEDIVQRLIAYETEHNTNYQIPKKYAPDPELGAWVTMVRRLGPDTIEPAKARKLNEIGFAWKSTRKCGSSFMTTYRSVSETLENCHTKEDFDRILETNEEVSKFLKAQGEVYRRGDLSEMRVGYMDKLVTKEILDWREF